MKTPEKVPPKGKKPYRSPVVEVYGSVRDLTKSLGGTGMNDSMSSSTTKTGL